MNFLAHLYLSGNSEGLIVGNFIGDFVKGKNYQNYPDEVAKGILIHRKIDAYTDQHTAVKQSIARLRPFYGKFSGIVVDMFYDHFLAIHWQKFHTLPLPVYCKETYDLLLKHEPSFPLRAKNVLPHIIQHNWLLSYAEIDGIQKSLKGIERRLKFSSNIGEATTQLEEYFMDFQEDFFNFFPDLEKYVDTLKREML